MTRNMAMAIKRQRVGCVGWLYNIDNEYGRTTAVCDLRPEVVARFTQNHPHVRGFSDYRAMVDSGAIDVVNIATPNELHRDMAEYALKKGVHVFLEKPMGVNREELDSIVATQQASGRHLAVDFELRIDFFARRAKELIDAGEIGTPVSVEFTHHRGAWLAGGNGVWRTDPTRSGGAFFMETCHEIDLFRYWFGEISAVQSFMLPNVFPQYRGGMPDNVCTHLWFESGVRGIILANSRSSVFDAPKAKYDELGHDMKFVIVGTKGAIRIDMIAQKFLICRYAEFHPDADRGVRVELNRIEDYSSLSGAGFFHDCQGNLQLFIRSMALGTPPHQTAADARITHLIGLEAERSAREDSKRIQITPLLEEWRNFFCETRSAARV